MVRSPATERRGAVLMDDHRALGLHRRVVHTSAGALVVRASDVTGTTATILLHGAAGSWTTWTPVLRAAQRAGDPLTDVIAIDLPGWGESRPMAGGLDVERLSGAVREVAESPGYRRWVLVGHSLGGFLALDVAARCPAQTATVLLVSPSGPAVLDAVRRPVRGGIALPGFAGMLAVMRLLAAFGSAGTRLVRSLHAMGALRPLSAPLFADPQHIHRSVIDALSTDVRPQAFADAARAASSYDESVWHAIVCPVRAIRGRRDVFVADADGVGFARLIDDFTQETLDGAGHFANIERPDAVREILRRILPAAPTAAADIAALR